MVQGQTPNAAEPWALCLGETPFWSRTTSLATIPYFSSRELPRESPTGMPSFTCETERYLALPALCLQICEWWTAPLRNPWGDKPDVYLWRSASEPRDQGYINRRRGVKLVLLLLEYGIQVRCACTIAGGLKLAVRVPVQPTSASIGTQLSPGRPDTPRIRKYTMYYTNTGIPL